MKVSSIKRIRRANALVNSLSFCHIYIASECPEKIRPRLNHDYDRPYIYSALPTLDQLHEGRAKFFVVDDDPTRHDHRKTRAVMIERITRDVKRSPVDLFGTDGLVADAMRFRSSGKSQAEKHTRGHHGGREH